MTKDKFGIDLIRNISACLFNVASNSPIFRGPEQEINTSTIANKTEGGALDSHPGKFAASPTRQSVGCPINGNIALFYIQIQQYN